MIYDFSFLGGVCDEALKRKGIWLSDKDFYWNPPMRDCPSIWTGKSLRKQQQKTKEIRAKKKIKTNFFSIFFIICSWNPTRKGEKGAQVCPVVPFATDIIIPWLLLYTNGERKRSLVVGSTCLKEALEAIHYCQNDFEKINGPYI